MKKVALAYYDGLDSTAMLTLKEKCEFIDVVLVLIDVGQDEEDINMAKERAETVDFNPVFFDEGCVRNRAHLWMHQANG